MKLLEIQNNSVNQSTTSMKDEENNSSKISRRKRFFKLPISKKIGIHYKNDLNNSDLDNKLYESEIKILNSETLGDRSAFFADK